MSTNSSTKITKPGLAESTAIAGRTVLVTGANRGLGQALVEEALRRGAKRVYAASRQPFTHPDERVTPLTLDVTDTAQIQAAVDLLTYALDQGILIDVDRWLLQTAVARLRLAVEQLGEATDDSS